MPKFYLEKTTSAKRESVYEIFSNYENYQKLIPQHFPSVRVRSVRDNVSVVEAPILHEVFIIGGDAKGSHIKEEFVDVPEGTKILVDVDLKIGGRLKISNMFAKNSIEENYSKILNDFVKIAEN